MFLAQHGLLGNPSGQLEEFTPIPNQVDSRSTFLSFTNGTNDWKGRPTPFKTSNGIWGLCWIEGPQHSGGTASEYRCNINFSNDEGATWTANNTYIGGAAVTGFPLATQASGAAVVNEVQVILCPNGDLVLLAFDRSSSWTNVSWSQWRSTDNGATWTFEQDFCTAIGVADATKIQAVYEHMISGATVYLILMEIRTSIDDTRIRLYKSTDNCATYTFVSNPVEYDEADPDCTESSIADLGNGNFFCIFRTQNLGNAVWKQSNDYGVTWGSLTDFSSVIGYVGVHQPRVKKFPNFFLLCGRDTKPVINDPTTLFHFRTAFWTTTDLFTTARKQYLDPFYAGNGTPLTDPGTADGGYGRFIQKADLSFMFFGYFGTNIAADIYKYEVSNTPTTPTEQYKNTGFFPETITDTGFRLQLNRDNFFEPAGVSPVNGGIAVMSRPHNTLATGSVYWTAEGTNRAEFFVVDDKGWAYFDGTSRLRSVTAVANTLFRNSFSVGFWLMPADGQPAATQVLFRDSSLTNTSVDDMVQIILNTDGRITTRYAINGTPADAQTENVIFANGAVTTPTHIAATFTSGGLIRNYVNGVLQGYNGANTGDMSALTMASYTNANEAHFGQRRTGASTWDLGYVGYAREILCQPVVWSAGDIANIMLN